ncbi:hypothetical protein TrVE_jg34 [Triparma verrucosa]|uniref:Calpain catalytic domain-containing protein n=1 Tax=Triparma verrucosa TaxID=1606542 RepID=A0A9W7FGW5_9STRA|nr:hypothetical protein TrVE_jg34 [Triparma verrucosa]
MISSDLYGAGLLAALFGAGAYFLLTSNRSALPDAGGLPAKGKKTYEGLRAECEALPPARAWRDDEFKHESSSMFESGCAPEGWLRDGERGRVLRDVRVVWEGPWAVCGSGRPLGRNTRGEPSWLFHAKEGEEDLMDAEDVQQGSLGDCYFLTALALVSTDTECTASLIDESLEQHGCYGVSFFLDGTWQMVYVDGFFPCYVSTKPHSVVKPRPCFASSGNRREIWPMVVEKAFAKLHGCWESIGRGGLIGVALQALTGGASTTLETKGGGEALWPLLMEAVEDPNVLVGAGTKASLGEAESMGVVCGHAYSVIHAVSVLGHKLLLLRNPWGHGEWKGDWSDGSKLWSENPEVAAAVGDGRSTEDDGRFWMSMEDFVRVFQSVDACRLPGDGHHQTHDAGLHRRDSGGGGGGGTGQSGGDKKEIAQHHKKDKKHKAHKKKKHK